MLLVNFRGAPLSPSLAEAITNSSGSLEVTSAGGLETNLTQGQSLYWSHLVQKKSARRMTEEMEESCFSLVLLAENAAEVMKGAGYAGVFLAGHLFSQGHALALQRFRICFHSPVDLRESLKVLGRHRCRRLNVQRQDPFLPQRPALPCSGDNARQASRRTIQHRNPGIFVFQAWRP